MDIDNRPFSARVQELVYNVEVGIGLRLIRGILYFLALGLLMLWFSGTHFKGLKEAEAMEYAQLGRNLLQTHRLQTQVIRPASMWYLIEHSRQHNPQMRAHPDIVHPPLYPALLALGFTGTRGSFEASAISGVFKPELWIIWLWGHLCTLLTGLLLFLLGRRLFDPRHGLLAATAFFLSASVWQLSISGLNLSLSVLLSVAAWYFAVVAVDRWQGGSALRRWLPFYLLALLAVTAGFYTRYSAALLVLPLALFIGFSQRKAHGWIWAAVFVGLFLAAISPWLARNILVSGGPLGLAPYLVLNDTRLFDGDAFERALAPVLQAGRIVDALEVKWLVRFAAFYAQPLRTVGEGLFICFFLTSFFFQFGRPLVNLLRWCVGLALLLLLLLAPLCGESTWRMLAIFWPLAILYGLAFLTVLVNRMQMTYRILRQGVIGLFLFLGALPLLLTLLPPREGPPYPPYHPPFVKHVSNLLKADEMICSDMPWATAWYGNRTSLYLPATLEDFYEISDSFRHISGLYFTTLTRDKPYVRQLLTGPYKSWFPILEGRVPSDFPLTQGFPLNNMDQIFLTDRTRYGE
ncbi:MAG: glycosyltransferase family 39 protein [Kiritimatiellaeota bacterium]|nr:glycosyltransferase family 39 protein [Kiritimatiellota bacterium]